MKQKRTFIAVLVVLAVLALGVAYALDAVDFEINGSVAATASQDNFKVNFVDIADAASVSKDLTEIDENDEVTLTLTAAEAGEQTASFTLTGFSTGGDTAVVEFDVVNTSVDLKAALGTLSVTATNQTDYTDYFTITPVYVDGEGVESSTITLDPVDGSATVKVTVVLDQTVLENVAAQTFTVSFDATPEL